MTWIREGKGRCVRMPRLEEQHDSQKAPDLKRR